MSQIEVITITLQSRTWVGHYRQQGASRVTPAVGMKKLFAGDAEHPGSYFGGYGRQQAWVSRDTHMRGSKRGKVYRFNLVEKIPGMEDSQQVPCNESSE